MNRILVFIVGASLMMVVTGCAWAAERTPAGSYLVYRATTVSDLRDQVAKNAAVRSRYLRHFHVSPADLDSFFADELSLVALKEPLRTKCWYIDKAGRQLIKTKLLPRGTMVFATANGQPVLSWSCGNPLRAELPVVMVKPSMETTPKPPVVSPESENPDIKVLPSVETITNALVMAPPAPAVVSALPVATPPVLATIAAPAVSAPPIILGSSLLGLLGGIALAGSSHPPPSVPEPSSLMALAGLLVMLPGVYRVSRRRR